jgi:metallo-beta-lactamase family protein
MLNKKDISKLINYYYVCTSCKKELNKKSGPMLIISASGMLSGGRVLHHLKAFAPFERNCILLTGFQAAGTRGEALERGATEIKVHGSYLPILAEVQNLDNLSAHADYQEIIEWFKTSAVSPKKVFVTHGEPSAADEFRRRLVENFDWNCSVPNEMQLVEFE